MSMTDFVFKQYDKLFDSKIDRNELCHSIITFARFLSKKLNISFFVPAKFVDGEWVILEEPKDYKNWVDVYIANITEGITKDRYTSQLEARMDCVEYQSSLSNVLFDGFKYGKYEADDYNPEYEFVKNDFCKIGFQHFGIKTMEDLIKYNLTLTASAKKILGL